MNNKYPFDISGTDPRDPDPWAALFLDQGPPMDTNAKAALLRGHNSFSRRILLPIIRPFARLSIILVQLLRIVLPEKIQSSWILHRSIYWGLKYFVKPEANYLIMRHFNIGSEILQFITDNIPNIKITRTKRLKVKKLEDLLDDTFLIHDLNIYNFIIELNEQLRAENRDITPAKEIDFSAISDQDFEFERFPQKWHNFIDLQTAIELYTPLYALFLSDKDFWRASNSLQLDETIAIYVGKLLNTSLHIAAVNNRYPTVPLSTLEAGFRLMLHGLDAENLYGFIKKIKDGSLQLNSTST